MPPERRQSVGQQMLERRMGRGVASGHWFRGPACHRLRPGVDGVVKKCGKKGKNIKEKEHFLGK